MSDILADEIARWMFFLSGVALLVAAFLLPATGDLRDVRELRDIALATEIHHLDRVDRYETFLSSVERADPATIELLAQSQLGVIPSDRDALILPGRPADPMVFELLEPDPMRPIAQASSASRLERLTTDPLSRLVVIAVGFASAMFGLLDPASPKRRSDSDADESHPVLRMQS